MAALERVGNASNVDAVWFARGGYGACRIAETAIARLEDKAPHKKWMGYSDTGFILAGLYKAGFEQLAHGPMPADVMREGGDKAIKRALRWLVDGETGGLEKGTTPGHPVAAFNLTILSHLVGTALEPDLSGHILMLEDVDEYMFRIDRAFFTVTSSRNIQKCAGIRLGRISEVRENDPPFEQNEEQVARYWCERSGIPYLGRADIGHDADNKIVPFG